MKQSIIRLIDDLDGTDIDDGAGRTVTFALDGTGYEIDLSTDNVERLEEALKPFIAAARKTGASKPTRTRARTNASAVETQAIRDWAKDNGYSVGDRGRISSEIRDAYAAR